MSRQYGEVQVSRACLSVTAFSPKHVDAEDDTYEVSFQVWKLCNTLRPLTHVEQMPSWDSEVSVTSASMLPGRQSKRIPSWSMMALEYHSAELLSHTREADLYFLCE